LYSDEHLLITHCHSGAVKLSVPTEAYIEALLVDEEMADLVWEAWNIGIITDDLAAMVWAILAIRVGP